MKTLIAILVAAAPLYSYPLDGAQRTGIRRLAGYQKFMKLPQGATQSGDLIKLHLTGEVNLDVRDPYLQSGLDRMFATRDPSYNIAVLDITDPAKPAYASIRADQKRIPGSVGKLLVATGVFGALQRKFPNDTAARERYLKETIITADSFVHRDGKTVPFYEPGAAKITNRRLEIGDKFSFYEWLDHMLSQSSNAAGSQVWKNLMLLYNPDAFSKQTSKKDLAALSLESIETALKASALDTTKLRIGTFFTSGGSNVVPGTASYASPNELLKLLIRIEQGRLVDPWSSLEMKRLMYFARPRYRYASSPALEKAMVYFKSGSLFECKPEPGFPCAQYKGNALNLMHSVAIVESNGKNYLVAMMSNVLKLNSALEHQKIATEIEALIQKRPR